MNVYQNNQKREVILIIPARIASTRLPKKVLLPIRNKPMMVHTYERIQSTQANRAFILTEDQEVYDVCSKFHTPCILSDSKGFISGTERIADWVKNSSISDESIVVNIQADEPFIDPKAIGEVVLALEKDPEAGLSTLWNYSTTQEDVFSNNKVKVVTDVFNRAIYFSRSVIPDFKRHDRAVKHKIHQGIYAYRKWALLSFKLLPENLSNIEKLEQLKFIEGGIKIATSESKYPTPLGIDTLNDYNRALNLI